ncbi:MAG TPA: hypothetical protein PLU21_03615 [Candidatus Saccharibacteria bacterium]|nr:hypothetical protein [Candidatus Saccharibacteria bacterium]
MSNIADLETLPGMPRLMSEAQIRAELEALPTEKLQELASNIIADVEQGEREPTGFGDELDLIIDILVKRVTLDDAAAYAKGELPLGLPPDPVSEEVTETTIIFQGSAVPSKEQIERDVWIRRDREHRLAQRTLFYMRPSRRKIK